MKISASGAHLYIRVLVLPLLLICRATIAADPARLDDPSAGEKLAAHLRSLAPAEEMVTTGILRISRSGGKPYEVPITSQAVIGEKDWTSIYTARLAAGEERLSIAHGTNKPNAYSWAVNGTSLKLIGNDATNHFAGSDFALMDLGMEFLHWPKQVLIKREMRKGRGCDVLESQPGGRSPYGRIVSWIDQETSGLLMAEAYDPSGRLLKEFEVKGFKKVAGQWQVHEMEIRNRQAKSATRLQFQFDK